MAPCPGMLTTHAHRVLTVTTARVPDGPPWAAGVIGHARPPDLRTWHVHRPLTGPSGSGQPEVPQVVATGPSATVVDGYTE